MIYETRDYEQMAEIAQEQGHPGLIECLRTRGLLQVTHLISTERYDDAGKVVELLERVKAI